MSRQGRGPVVVLGGFDGFHLGHRELLHVAADIAAREQLQTVAVVMDDAAVVEHLSPVAERCRLAMMHGAGAVHVVTVDSRDAGAADQVVHEVVSRIEPSMIVMACLPASDDDARFPSLRRTIRRHEVPLAEIDRWSGVDRQPVTSAAIAESLAAGDVVRAAAQLGRPYTIDGIVVHGSGLGRTIGFPTANIPPPGDQVLPARGVYAAMVTVGDGSVHRAAVNVGVRPTVEEHGGLLVEAHLLDFDDDLYGQRLRVAFHLWLRGEQHFGSLDGLIAQLARDATRAGIALR